jgi:hypothetical protein
MRSATWNPQPTVAALRGIASDDQMWTFFGKMYRFVAFDGEVAQPAFNLRAMIPQVDVGATAVAGAAGIGSGTMAFRKRWAAQRTIQSDSMPGAVSKAL